MTFRERERLKQAVDRQVRERIARAHGRDISPNDVRIWKEAERAEARGKAA